MLNVSFKKLIFGSFLLKLLSATLGLAIYFLLASSIPTAEFGLFALCISLGLLLAGLAKQGTENLLIRFTNEVGYQSTLYAVCLLLVIFLWGLITALLCIYPLSISLWFSIPNIADVLPYISAYALCNSLQAVNAALLNALHKPKLSLFFSGVLSQLLFLFFFSFNPPDNAQNAFKLQLVCQALSLIASFLTAWYLCLPSIKGITRLPLRKLFNSNGYFFTIALLMVVTQQAPPIIVAKYASLNDVAFLAIALKVGVFFAYPLVAVNKVCGPYYSRFWAEGDVKGIIKLAQSTRKKLMLIATIGILCVFVFIEHILLLFGGDYVEAATFIKVLAVGQWVNLATGSAVLILLMTGHERIHLYQNLAITFFYVVALIIFVPIFGAFAAVCLMSGSMIAKNALSIYMVKNKIFKLVK
jgi:O-antigen/teichoic acid export membrane protein